MIYKRSHRVHYHDAEHNSLNVTGKTAYENGQQSAHYPGYIFSCGSKRRGQECGQDSKQG